MKRITLILLLTLTAWATHAKSIVLITTDGTRVYYPITSDAPAQMILADDGTLTMNTKEYAITDLVGFAYSATDYTGEEGTTNGLTLVKGTDATRVYSLDGKPLGASLNALPRGTYIVSDGKASIKVVKP